MAQSRNTYVNIIYQGADITRDIAPYLLSFTFTDNSKDKADDISITMHDASGLWLKDWTPSKSDIITASIVHHESESVYTLPCGSFSLDQIEYSSPPQIFTIKAVSASITKRPSLEKHSRFWENVKLSDILTDLAASSSLALFLDGNADYPIARIDQTNQSDADFARQLCSDYGLGVKLQEGRLVVYDIEDYENKGPVLSIAADDGRLISIKFTSKSAKVYRKARVHYHDPVKDEDYLEEYEDDAVDGSERELDIYERVESAADAKRVAEERLTETNRKEITGSLTLKGDVSLAAGVTVELSGFGMFSGKYMINKAAHKVDSSGYTTSLELGLPKAEKTKVKGKVSARKSKRVPAQLFYEGDSYYH